MQKQVAETANSDFQSVFDKELANYQENYNAAADEHDGDEIMIRPDLDTDEDQP